ncbi:MAG: radical SAM protein [Gammaproteobacteria bacterium]|nr:radical SAM protein [Gammaproteobacteria bacterium]
MFSSLSRKSLAQALLLKNVPIYVQFYITARCNLTCQQCNIIYSNSDLRECTLPEIEMIAENLAQLGVAIVLLTGGEPFLRHDLPEIIRAFESRGIHVRMQTNGLASEKQIDSVIKAGGKDISISLDSLTPDSQDHINGGFKGTWEQAILTMGMFMERLPLKDSFASLGCVLQKDNIDDIESVIEFGSEIGWFTSLVPTHVTQLSQPRGFRSFDEDQRFTEDYFHRVENLIERVRAMRKEGYLLYDSDQYLDDILNFVRGEPVGWRERNGGVCDTPNLYFAILPNGQFAPCCDHRTKSVFYTYAKDFPKTYRSKLLRQETYAVAKACEGCMYGSYPEMTISMRFLKATLQRAHTFLSSPPPKPWPISGKQALEIATEVRGRMQSKQKAN